MKRLCILTSVHRAFDTRIFYKQAKSLAKSGYDVTLIAQHNKDEVVDGVKIVALPRPRNRFWRMLGIWRTFRLALRQKADIYHFHDPELLPWGWLLRKLTRKPVIYDVHEYYTDVIPFKAWIPYFLRKPIAWLFDRIEKFFAGGLSAIITVTEPMKKRFSDSRVLCVSVHNFTSIEIAVSANESKRFSKGEHRYSVICSGGSRLARENVFETVLDALDLVVKQNSKITCVILGTASNPARLDEEHDNLMKKLSQEGNLKIIDRVCYNDLFRYLDVASIGWKPEPVRQKNSIQTRALEYMARGKPVVAASDSSLTADIIREARCGILVDPYDAKAHASAILYILEHPDEARKMGENGKKAVLEKYNWETESKKLLNLYRVICQ